MSHADGSLAEGALAVSEVQGYAYAAFRAAALVRRCSASRAARAWRARRGHAAARFHEAFWLDDLDTYAMALDGEKRPLRVRNSDAGHLLWTGIVPDEPRAAPRPLAARAPATWSGWGLRTLGAGEARYNPVSYHNGSVWPHDTALFAAGLARYGFAAEARRWCATPSTTSPPRSPTCGCPSSSPATRATSAARALPGRLPAAGLGRGRARAPAHARRRRRPPRRRR
jgi:glycogen debranching enzyme